MTKKQLFHLVITQGRKRLVDIKLPHRKVIRVMKAYKKQFTGGGKHKAYLKASIEEIKA